MGKQKLYLDTNIIHDLFTRQAQVLEEGEKIERPRKYLFLLSHQDKYDFVVSFLTKAEIMREMVSAHGMKQEVVEQAWNDFTQSLHPVYIRQFTFDETLVDIIGKSRMKLRTMINFFHLFIAMEEAAYFVTGDKQIIEKIKETLAYDKVLSYIDLQKEQFIG